MHHSRKFLERNFKELIAMYRTRNRQESDWHDYNQLCEALRCGNRELSRQLIKNGAKLNKNPFIFPCNTPLHLAVILGCPEMVQMLIDRGAFVSRKALNDDTPLIMAAKMGRNAIVDILLSANGALNTSSVENLSHMHIACMKNRSDIVKNMIQRGVDVNNCVSSESFYWPGFTPLHFAVLSQEIEIVELLLDNGADILKKDARHLTPLHLAHMVRNEPIIDLILTAHKSEFANPKSLDGLTHFHIACTRNDTSVVQHFMNMDYNSINEVVHSSVNWADWKPIDFALYYQCLDVFKLLLSNGARFDPDHPKDLMSCIIMQENKDVFYAILQQSLKESEYEDPLGDLSDFHRACYVEDLQKLGEFSFVQGEVNQVNTFLSNRIPCTPLHLALRRRNEIQARLLLRCDPDIAIQDTNGDTPLHLAFEYGMLEIAKEMVNTLLKPDSNPTNSRGLSHFHIACACSEEIPDSRRNLIGNFLDNGVDINVQVSSTSKLWPKWTPLHFAVKFHQLKNIQTLLEHRADTKLKNKFNSTPVEMNIVDLHFHENDRLDFQRFKILHKILSFEANAKVEYSDNEGFTLLHALCVLEEPNLLQEYLASQKNISLDINKIVGCSESRWYGFSTLHLAITYGRGKNAVILQRHGADVGILKKENVHKLFYCLYGEFPTTFQSRFAPIINQPKLLNILDNLNCVSGLNLLHVVCVSYDLQAVNALILRNTEDPTEIINARNSQGDTPLHSLLKCKSYVSTLIVQLLLEKGADPNARDRSMRTPLHLVISDNNNSYGLIDLLVSYGADVEARDLLNRTPLYSPFIEESPSIFAEKLLEHGADMNVTDCNGKAPFSYVSSQNEPYQANGHQYFVLKYVTKLQVLGMYVSQNVKDTYSALLGSRYGRWPFNKIKLTEACSEEIEVLKCTKINSNTTLRDILLKSNDQLAIFCENPILQDLINSADFAEKFPLYGNLVKSQVKKGLIRKSLLLTCEPSLDKLFRMSLPLSCRELISHHLSNQDLKNVDDSFNGV